MLASGGVTIPDTPDAKDEGRRGVLTPDGAEFIGASNTGDDGIDLICATAALGDADLSKRCDDEECAYLGICLSGLASVGVYDLVHCVLGDHGGGLTTVSGDRALQRSSGDSSRTRC